jgi:hypothetical protein
MPRSLSPQLTRLLLVRGAVRFITPAAVVWGIYDWWLIRPLYGLIYAALTFNYVLVLVLAFTAPALMNGPWRIRPAQTFILLINVIALPIAFKQTFGALPWGFIAVSALMIAGLYAATAIHLYLQEKMPASTVFAHSNREAAPGPGKTAPGDPVPRPSNTH